MENDQRADLTPTQGCCLTTLVLFGLALTGLVLAIAVSFL